MTTLHPHPAGALKRATSWLTTAASLAVPVVAMSACTVSAGSGGGAVGTVLGQQATVGEPTRPEETEVWEPAPPIVEPGRAGDPPSDAIILFDGTDLSAWRDEGGDDAAWSVADGAMTVVPGTGDIRSREGFGDMQLHIEWRTPAEVSGEGQGRGNSGIFFMERYELQVLDSYENRTYANGQAGSVYKQHFPLVNASRRPGEWQSFDVAFTAPRFGDDGSLTRPASMTVFHNGVLIQNQVELGGPTVFIGLPKYEEHGDRLPIRLQDHGNPVSYRNIWLREIAGGTQPAGGSTDR